jgi:hypothetical protein
MLETVSFEGYRSELINCLKQMEENEMMEWKGQKKGREELNN